MAIAATAIEDVDIVATDAKLRRRYPAGAHTIRSLIPEASDKHRASVSPEWKGHLRVLTRVFGWLGLQPDRETKNLVFLSLPRTSHAHAALIRPHLYTPNPSAPGSGREQCFFNNARWPMKRRKETQKLKYKICPRRRAPLDADVFSPVEIKSPLDAELISIPDSPPLTFSRWRLMPSQWTEKAVLNSQSPKSPWTTSDTSHPKVPSIYWGN